MASTVDTLAQGQVSLTTSLNTLSQTLETFIKAQISNSGNSSGSNGNTGSNGSSLPPSGTSTTNGNPAPSGAPQSYLHAKAEKEGKIIIEYPSCTMIGVPHLNSDNDDVYFTADDFISTPLKTPLDNIPKDSTHLPEIMPLRPADQGGGYGMDICTADLEAIIKASKSRKLLKLVLLVKILRRNYP